jgi:hypothetical protein
MLFRNRTEPQEIELVGKVVKTVNCVKYLGVLVDQRLSFKDHISYVCKRVSKLTGLVYKVRDILIRDNLLLFYNYYVKPVIQYGVLVYGGTSKNKLLPIVLRQKRFLRGVFRLRFRDHVTCKFEAHSFLTVHELYVY